MKRVHTQPFVVVAAIIEKDGKFLLVQEAWGPVKGLWNTPAGWLDLGEDPVGASAREAKEETGYNFTPEALLGIYSSVKTEGGELKHPVKLAFKGSITGEQLPVDQAEINQSKWFTPEEIYRMDSKTLRDANIKQIIKDYLAGKQYPLGIIRHSAGHQW